MCLKAFGVGLVLGDKLLLVKIQCTQKIIFWDKEIG
jgi:hypothetical protein